jgi:DNA polymerase-3 subunit delta
MARPAPSFYVFHGTDEFSIAETIADFKQRLGPPDMVDLNTTELDGKDLTLAELRHACDAIPFLAERRLVIASNVLKRLATRKDRELPRSLAEFLEALLQYLPQLPRTTRLVFVEDEPLPSNHPVVKLAREQARGYLKRFDPPAKDDLRRWVQERARKHGGWIERKAAEQLAVVVGDSLRLLDQEILKLVTFTNGDRPITSEDVDTLVPYVQEAVVFDLVDSLGHQDASAASGVLHRLLAAGEHPLAILAMVVRQFRLLIQVKELEQSGSSLQDVVRTLKLHPFPARKLHVQAIRFTNAQLEAIYHLLLDTDVAIKTGEIAPDLALDLLVAELAATSPVVDIPARSSS